MGIDFMPQNALEQAIYDCNGEMIIYAIAENNMLTTLAPASNLGNDCFTDEIVFSILFNAVTEKQLQMMTNGWFWGHLKVKARLRELINETLTPLPQNPTDIEKKLIQAIVYRDSDKLIHLIKNEKAKFYGFAPELLIMLPELSPESTLIFLRDGLSPKLKAIVLRIFLKETHTPDLLANFSYGERCKYANLMIKILTGKTILSDDI